jgi:DNA-binding beta-propeller fold protein YncE
MPKQVWVDQPGLYPEGLEYDSQRNSFLVTSLKEGSVGIVDKTGKYTRLVNDSNLISAIGIRLDKKRNRILVANSDPGVSVKTSPATQKKIAGLGIYKLSDGSLIQYVNLSALMPPAPHFANDIALDEKDGTAYVTDSFSPVIYKVTVDGQASIFLKDQKFEGEGFNLNGIVLIKDYLIAAKDNDGTLYKIPLNDPKSFSQVETKEKFIGADGLLKDVNGDLIISANGPAQTVYKLLTTNDFKSAKVIASNKENWRFNTTGVLVCDLPYILNAELDSLFGGKPPVAKFEIRRVDF